MEPVERDGRAHLLIDLAEKAQKAGQSQTKLVFGAENVERFRSRCEEAGLFFGAFIKAMAMSSQMRAIPPAT